MSADTPTHWLDCPDCSCRVFARAEDLFGDGESEHCAACGSLVTISTDATDAESPLGVRVDEHGGAVVTRLRRAIFGAERDRDSAAEGLADVRVERDKALAEAEQLRYEADYTPPPGKVSDVARARIMTALEADSEDCVRPGCVPAHTALEVLGAHDDAARDVDRLTEDETERVQDARHAMRLARIDRAGAQAEAARLRQRVAEVEGELAELLAWAEDQACEMQADDRGGYTPDECSPHHSGRCWPCEAKVRATTRDGGTPTGPTTPANIEIAWSALRVAASRHGSAPVRGVDVDLLEAYEMALTEARATPSLTELLSSISRFIAAVRESGLTPDAEFIALATEDDGAAPSMTGPEFIAAARKSGLFTAEEVEEIREGVRRHRGDPVKHVDAFIGTLSGDETEGEFIAIATADDGATPSAPETDEEFAERTHDEFREAQDGGDPGGES